jgi:L-fuculose-phosphate aldolase
MLTAMGDVMREAYKRNWITTRDGNISLKRKNSNLLYITPSGVRKTIIHPEQIIKIPIKEGELDLAEGINPSGELHMHWNIQKNTPRTRAVVHLHPTFCVAAMHAGLCLNEIVKPFPELYRYTRVGKNVSSHPPLTLELANETALRLAVQRDGSCEFDIVGQKGHGVCSVGPDPWTAFEHIERLEHICKIVLLSGNY